MVLLYFLINVIYFRVLGFFMVTNSHHVASDAAVSLQEQTAARWLTLFMILSALGSLHVNFLARPRVVYAMARDGKFFSFLSEYTQLSHTQWCNPFSRLLGRSSGLNGHF